MHPVSRREFLQRSGATVLAGTAMLHGLGPLRVSPALAQGAGFLNAAQRSTLGAAVTQIVPASGPDDWSAADLGGVDYIDNLLSGFGFLDRDTGAIYPGGPYRDSSSEGPGFYTFQDLSRVKKLGWEQQVSAWQSLYADGLAHLDTLAPGGFAATGRFWGIPNLYVADGSVFPTSGGYNPTLTIQAMAWRTADNIIASGQLR